MYDTNPRILFAPIVAYYGAIVWRTIVNKDNFIDSITKHTLNTSIKSLFCFIYWNYNSKVRFHFNEQKLRSLQILTFPYHLGYLHRHIKYMFFFLAPFPGVYLLFPDHNNC